MVLYINSCIRNNSRTEFLAKKILEKEQKEYKELKLKELKLKPLDEKILERRTEVLESGDFNNPIVALSKEFSEATEIYISAPLWDNTFPAILKIYLENIYCVGIVSEYDCYGNPIGLCKAKRLTFITTSGGPYKIDFSYNYIKDLVTNYFGIKETRLIKAECLDIIGADVSKILNEAIKNS